METIKFATSKLASFAMITKPGKYTVSVLNNVSEKNLYSDENGRDRYIVSLRAIAGDKLAQVKEVFAGKPEVSIEETNGLFLTASIWKNGDEQPALPMKGEEIEVTVGFVPSRDGEEVLRVTNTRILAAQAAPKFSLEAIAQEATELAHAI